MAASVITCWHCVSVCYSKYLDACALLSVTVNVISPSGPSARNGVLTVHFTCGVHFCSPAIEKKRRWRKEK
jgi:hypothetical protein